MWQKQNKRCEKKLGIYCPYHFSSVQSFSHIRLFSIPWIAARQASLSINSRSSLKLMSIESMMPSSRLILCCPFLLLSPIPPSIRVFSSESTVLMRWPKYWSFSFSISPSSEHPYSRHERGYHVKVDCLDKMYMVNPKVFNFLKRVVHDNSIM